MSKPNRIGYMADRMRASNLQGVARELHRTSTATPIVEVPKALTATEIKVLALVRAGLCNKEIAQRLHVAECTVKFHVSSLLHKKRVTRLGLIAQQCPEGCPFRMEG